MNKHHYSKRKKLEILEETKSAKSAEVAKKYGISVQSIYLWRMKYLNHLEASKNDNSVKSNRLQEIELEKDTLKKICMALTYENYSLKEMLEKKSLKQNVFQR